MCRKIKGRNLKEGGRNGEGADKTDYFLTKTEYDNQAITTCLINNQ